MQPAPRARGPKPQRHADHREQEQHDDVGQLEQGQQRRRQQRRGGARPRGARRSRASRRRRPRRAAGAAAPATARLRAARPATTSSSSAEPADRFGQRRPPGHFCRRRPAEHDAREVVLARVAHQRRRGSGAASVAVVAPSSLRQLEHAQHAACAPSAASVPAPAFRRAPHATALRAAPPAARQLRTTFSPCRARPDAGQQRLARGPHRLHRDCARRYACISFVDAIGGAAQRQLAQREQVALAEEVASPRARPAPGCTPCPPSVAPAVRRAADRRPRLRRPRRTTRSGTVSHTRTPVMPLTMSFRLSRCCTFIVVQTSMPASSSSCDVLPALGVARARRRSLCASSSTSTSARLARRSERGVEVELRQHAVAVGHRLHRQARQVGAMRFGLGAAVRLDDARPRRRCRRLRARVRRPASRRSCRPRPTRRRRSSACRAARAPRRPASARAAHRGRGGRPLRSWRSDPTCAAEAPEQEARGAGDDAERHRVAVGPLQLGHVLEVHAPDAGQRGGHARRSPPTPPAAWWSPTPRSSPSTG